MIGAYTLLTFIQFRSVCVSGHELNGCYTVRDPQDLALVAAAAMGAAPRSHPLHPYRGS